MTFERKVVLRDCWIDIMDGNSSFNATKCKANRRRVCCICLAIEEYANTSMLHTNTTGYTFNYEQHTALNMLNRFLH